MPAREAIPVGLQGVRSEAMLEASSMSEERGRRPVVPCAHRAAPILAFLCVPPADKDLPGIRPLARLAEGTKSSATRFT